GTISQEEADRARRSRIEINPKAREFLQSTIAPYFYSYVFDELKFLLGEQLAREGNFIVETGLNPTLQKVAESSLRSAVENSGARAGFSEGAVVTLNTKTGEVLALVGGVNYRQSQFNRATQALRQPGSTFKIFTYAAALERGISPNKGYSCE
ncbi:penicillin-binding transpeptidase domain-containing protein, partial [Microcoleus anatoxicus]|uniref:penicillin-binding transpeptidase domain-containing protein n=1 Tax=Microcoleus anatoxicus TaxID=2705319 RepID=UPI0030CA0832